MNIVRCIVYAMFDLFQTLSKTLRSMFFSKHRLKIASLRIWKHCIVKKSEYRPTLSGVGAWDACASKNILSWLVNQNTYQSFSVSSYPVLKHVWLFWKLSLITINCIKQPSLWAGSRVDVNIDSLGRLRSKNQTNYCCFTSKSSKG